MDRRKFLAVLGATPFISFAPQASAANAVVDSVNTYLTNLHTMRARFSQLSADGTVLNGIFYLQKPGRMRFEYDPPSPSLIISDGTVLAIFDSKSSRGPARYPQSSTPLSLLARNNIDVTKSKFVRLIEVRSGNIYITMFDPDSPNTGTMELVLAQHPMALTQWSITDSRGAQSVIKLGPSATNISLDKNLFNIVYNVHARENNG